MSSPRTAAQLPSDQLEPAVRILRRTARFWWVGVITFVVVGAAAVAAVLLAPRKYKSEASLQYREGMQWSADEAVNTRRVGQRLRELALSRAQLGKAIEELGLYPELVQAGRMAEAVEEMRLATGFRFDQSDVFLISFMGESPEQAQQVTARLVEMLIAENKRMRSQQAEVAREFLDAEKASKAEELALKEAEQVRFLSKHPEFAQEQTTGMGVTIRARQNRRDEPAVVDDAAARAQRPTMPPQDAALVAAKNAAEGRLTAALRDLADKRSRLTEEHPDTRAAAANAAEAELAYRRALEALGPSQPAAGPGPARGASAPAFRASGAPASPRNVALETEWARLTREVTEARERLQQLDNQQFRAAMTASMLTSGQTGQILVIDPPFLPARPVGVRNKILLLLALGGAFAVGLAVAVALGLLDDLVYDPSDVERLQIAPVLAEVAQRGLRAPADGRRKDGGVSLGGNDLDRPVRLPKVREIASFAAKRTLELPAASDGVASADAARAMVVAGSQGPRAVGGEDANVRRRASAQIVHMAEPRERERARKKTRYFSFINDFADGDEADPAAHEEVSPEHLIRIHRPEPGGTVDGRVVMLAAPDSPAASGFRVLRHRLATRKDVRTILVTSPRSGEGKTLASVNLALALGEGGRARVLLVEANFRTPAVARLLGFQPPVGLAQQLELHRAEPAERWDVVEAVAPWLHVLAVSPDGETASALDARALTLCIEELRQVGYDYIVIDSPAVLESADVNLIEESADGIVVAMWARRSHARAFRKAAEQVGVGKVLGVVLLGT